MSGSLQPVAFASLFATARATPGWVFTSAGMLTEIAAGQPRFDHDPAALARRGLLIEPSATNAWTNARWEGGVAGTPGTPPTATAFTSTAGGLTREIIGVGAEDGIPYIDVRFSGVAASAANVLFGIAVGSGPVVAVGQTWAFAFAWRVIAGAFAPFTSPTLFWRERQGATQLLAAPVTVAAPTIAPLRQQVQRFTRTLTQATVDNITPEIGVARTNGAAHDLTLRLAAWQLELGPVATSLILPPVGAPAAATRDADDVSRVLTAVEFTPTGFAFAAEGLVSAQASVARHLVAFDDGTANNAIAIRIPASSSSVQLVVVNGGVETVTTIGTLTLGTPFRVAASCTAGVMLASLNGAAATGNAAAMPAVTTLRLGRLGASGNLLRGWVRGVWLGRGIRAGVDLPSLSVPGTAYL